MELGIRPGTGSSLSVRLAWLTALRLLVLTVFLVVTGSAYVGGFTYGSYSSKVALVAIASAYGLAAVYAALLRIGRRLPEITYAQLVTDQITWTGIVYITGGATSGATSLYGLTALSGAILLGVRGAITAAIAGATFYALLCGAFWARMVLPPVDQQVAYATQWADMAYPLFVNMLALSVVTLLASYLAERLRTTGGHLVAATARAEEAERLASLGRLAAGLAHEIRNPLGSIAGSIELLRTGNTLSAEDKRLCEIIERETARLNALVGDMLDLSRPRAPSKTDVDLGGIARDVVTLAGTSGRGSDVGLRYVGPPASLVSADAAQLRQVVWNLVRNAIQASKPGDEVVVELGEAPEGDLLLAITDRGAGIKAEARERLFDAFFTTRSHGMGIGLAVVKRIVDDHGFEIDVESEEGRGTTFRVRIPRGARPAAPAQPEAEASDVSASLAP